MRNTRGLLLATLAFVAFLPSNTEAAICQQELVMVSPSGCTAVYCDLVGSITDLNTGRTKCYYDNCGVVYIENCK
ncbi:MAG: hypothetical protein ACTHQM_20020 [Thermoanaerobaculia bacterium]